MAKSYLTREELASMFRTVPVLTAECGEQNPEKWGLLIRGTKSRFGTACPGWTLCFSLTQIRAGVVKKFFPGAEKAEDILFYYEIDVRTGELGEREPEFVRILPLQILQPGFRVTVPPEIPTSH